MGVPDEYWVEFTVYKMEGLANTWWKQVKRIMDVVGMTWEQFETLFNDQYFPQSYCDVPRPHGAVAVPYSTLLMG